MSVRLACANARQADFEALEANIERTDLATREGRLLDRVECSREFYKLLALATGNKVIAMIMDSVTEIHMRFVYAKVASSGAATPRLAEKRRQFLSALRATRRFGCYAADAVSSGVRSADAGAGPGRHVASCRLGGDAAGHAPLRDSGADKVGVASKNIREEKMSRYAKYECLTVEVAEKVATVTLNRPQARNAINQKLIRELRTIWDDLADDHAVNVVVLTGAGDFFSVGGDVKAMSERPGGDVLEEGEVHDPMISRRGVTRQLELDKPIIAAINGDAIGLAATHALALRYHHHGRRRPHRRHACLPGRSRRG